MIENLLVFGEVARGSVEHVVSGQHNLWLETDKEGGGRAGANCKLQTATPFPNRSASLRLQEVQSLCPCSAFCSTYKTYTYIHTVPKRMETFPYKSLPSHQSVTCCPVPSFQCWVL